MAVLMHVVQKSSWAALKADPGDGCRQREGDKAGSERDPQAPDNRPLGGGGRGSRAGPSVSLDLKAE